MKIIELCGWCSRRNVQSRIAAVAPPSTAARFPMLCHDGIRMHEAPRRRGRRRYRGKRVFFAYPSISTAQVENHPVFGMKFPPKFVPALRGLLRYFRVPSFRPERAFPESARIPRIRESPFKSGGVALESARGEPESRLPLKSRRRCGRNDGPLENTRSRRNSQTESRRYRAS